MIIYPCAKINIGLRVVEKRPDGFHNLETFFLPAPVSDILEVVESQETTLNIYGMETGCSMADNLCVKAYILLRDIYSLPPVEIHLYKRIPVGAGLGGGSSDASHMIIALNKLFGLGMTCEKMAEHASKLGSDCPFFIYSGLLDVSTGEGLYAQGRGDILTPCTVPQLMGLKIKIEFPPVFVSTAEAYQGVKPYKTGVPLKELLKYPVEEWREQVINDFEPSVFYRYPLIEEYKKRLYKKGAVYASMSGSGSAVFGLFRE
jgi:4-diphosphocytidyl-2-C-methyl-D-erythritol kinase